MSKAVRGATTCRAMVLLALAGLIRSLIWSSTTKTTNLFNCATNDDINALENGKITWDGDVILTDYQRGIPFDPGGIFKIIYVDQGNLVDDTMG
mmetsp:Transcript_58931/g.129361  ORF Transcript_58931/g.129361 Transcript_58931/m.129361 type:complete len:94 (-) Transcript_58931:221-502(-)